MTAMRRYVLTNFAATATLALLNIGLVPIYIRFLGIESYGLVGLFATLQSTLILLDLGLSATTSRELARLRALSGREMELRNFSRTLEIVYWGVGLMIALAIAIAAPYIAATWLRAPTLEPLTLRASFRLMALMLLFQWPVVFYTGALQGLQRHGLLNLINIVANLTRFVGAAVVAALSHGDVLVFFAWQVLIVALQALALREALWRVAPAADRPARFDLARLIPTWRFAAGMSGIAVNSVVLTQADKLVLSRLLTLEDFGYYALACVVAQSLLLFSSPIAKSVFPRFSQLVAAGADSELRTSFHHACQVLAIGVLSTGLVLAVFASEVMHLWTGSVTTAARTAEVVTLLVLGSSCMALQVVPYQLALAHGHTRLNFRIGIAAIAVVVPLLIVFARAYGALGGALAWLACNLVTTPIYIHLLLRRFLPGEELRWYVNDFLRPLAGASVPILAFRLIGPAPAGLPGRLGFLAALGITSLVGSAIATPYSRTVFRGYLATRRFGRPSGASQAVR